MMRYQIKIVDAHLVDLVDEIVTRSLKAAVASGKGVYRDREAYPAVFEACKAFLKGTVRGFHVCGCVAHCDAASGPTELADPSDPPRGACGLDHRSSRIRRYVLLLDIPLRTFARDLAVRILRAIPAYADPGDRKLRHLYPEVLETVGKVLGKYLQFSPECNREQYLCEVGVRTEFDAWEAVQPRGDRRWPGRHGGYGRRRTAFRGDRRRAAKPVK